MRELLSKKKKIPEPREIFFAITCKKNRGVWLNRKSARFASARHRDRNPASPYTAVSSFCSISLVVRTPRCGRGNPGSNPGWSKKKNFYSSGLGLVGL